MAKKIFQIIGVFILTTILTATTCNKTTEYWEIGEIEAFFHGYQSNIIYNDTLKPITDDSIIMYLNIIPITFVVDNINLSTIKEANALSPVSPSLIRSISSLTISSDKTFNGIAAGNNLNNYFTLLEYAYYDQTNSKWRYHDTLSVEEFVDKHLIKGAELYEVQMPIFIFKKYDDITKQVLYFDFIDTQGKHYIGKSDTLWVE